MTDIPYLGLGLSTNLEPGQPPNPYRLLSSQPDLFDYVEYSAPVSLPAARRRTGLFATMEANRDVVPAVLHPVQLNLWGPALETPDDLARLNEHALAVGSPWVSNDVGWWHVGGRMLPGCLYLTPPLTEAGVDACAHHANHVQRHLDVPLLLENPTLFSCHGPMHVADFMARLQQRTGRPLILDLGHFYSHQLSRGLPLDHGLDRLPLEAVWELHIAGGVLTRRGERLFYVDDHPQPVHDVLFGLLERLLQRLPNLRAVTFEGDGHPEPLARRTLERLRPLIPPPPGAPIPAPPSPIEVFGGPPGAEVAWHRFDQLRGAAPLEEDIEADRAEQDFRLSVLVDRLDRRVPLTRLLFAGARSDLLAFTASRDYAAPYRGERAEALHTRFSRWALARATGAAAAVIEMEQEVGALADAPPPPPPLPGQVGLASNVRLGVLPTDFGELLHAAGALKRHLLGRALATGDFDPVGLSVLRDLAARAPARPWPVAVRNGGSRLEVLGLAPPLADCLVQARTHPTQAALAQAHPAAFREAVRLGLLAAGT